MQIASINLMLITLNLHFYLLKSECFSFTSAGTLQSAGYSTINITLIYLQMNNYFIHCIFKLDQSMVMNQLRLYY